jgi:long-subunit acyl-CoA synthetase (AMP-forming)
LPLEPLSHCLVHTQCKLVILDAERARLIQPAVQKLRKDSEIQAFMVFNDQTLNNWQDLLSFDQTLQQYHSDGTEAITSVDTIKPEDNATIIFTSGFLTLFQKYVHV